MMNEGMATVLPVCYKFPKENFIESCVTIQNHCMPVVLQCKQHKHIEALLEILAETNIAAVIALKHLATAN